MPTSGQTERATHSGGRGRWLFAWALALVGVIVRGPAVRVGYLSDDHWQLAMLRGTYGVERGPFTLFSFVRGDPAEFEALRGTGVLPWWASEDLSFNFMRPLSSLFRWLDAQLWPEQPALQHLHSMAWWVALLVVVGLLLWRLLPPSMAVAAGLVYVLDTSSIYPVAWLANRSSLIAATFAVSALLLHLRWREDDWRTGRWLSPACYALALLAGEYALPLLGLLGAYELLRPGPLRERALAALPMVALGVTFVLAHRALGFGTNLDLMYVDPFESPGLWVGRAGKRWLQLWGSMSLGLPIGLGALQSRAGWLLEGLGLYQDGAQRAVHLLLAIVSIPAGVGLLWLARRGLTPEEWRTAAWLGLGAAAALLPLTAVEAHARLLQLPTLGLAGATGAVAVATWRGLVGRGPGDTARRRVGALVAAPLLLPILWAQTVGDARWGYYGMKALDRRAVHLEEVCWNDAMQAVDLEGKDVILLNAWDKDVALLCGFVNELHGARPRSWQTLGIVDAAMVVQRAGRRGLRISVVDGDPWLTTSNEYFCRARSDAIDRGQVFESGGMSVRVEGVDPHGYPTRIRVQLEDAVDDPRYVWLRFEEDGLRPVKPPQGRKLLPLRRLEVTVPEVIPR